MFSKCIQYLSHTSYRMETIEERSVLLNWNHEDASINPTPGDTIVMTNKDDNDELLIGNRTTDGSNTWEGECQFVNISAGASENSELHPLDVDSVHVFVRKYLFNRLSSYCRTGRRRSSRIRII